MNNQIDQTEVGVTTPAKPATSGPVRWIGKGVAAAVIVAVAATAFHMHWSSAAPVVAPPPPSVAISAPLQRDIEGRLGFLGQFSAVNRVELRAQVGGTLTQINFKDGDIVHKGDVLFEIDPEPYQIKLSQATAGTRIRECPAGARHARACPRAGTAAFGRGHGRERRPESRGTTRCSSGRRQRQCAGSRRQVRSGSLQDHGTVHRAHRYAPRLDGQSGVRQPRRQRPDHAARDHRFAGPDLSGFRHQRKRLRRFPALA